MKKKTILENKEEDDVARDIRESLEDYEAGRYTKC